MGCRLVRCKDELPKAPLCYATIVAQQGWKAICQQITPEGQVKGVCMGTGISRDLPFYYNRPAPLNDAHGLGAVVQAGIEINNVTTKTTE